MEIEGQTSQQKTDRAADGLPVDDSWIDVVVKEITPDFLPLLPIRSTRVREEARNFTPVMTEEELTDERVQWFINLRCDQARKWCADTRTKNAALIRAAIAKAKPKLEDLVVGATYLIDHSTCFRPWKGLAVFDGIDILPEYEKGSLCFTCEDGVLGVFPRSAVMGRHK